LIYIQQLVTMHVILDKYQPFEKHSQKITLK